MGTLKVQRGHTLIWRRCVGDLVRRLGVASSARASQTIRDALDAVLEIVAATPVMTTR